jgi:hypothetical protein
MMIGPSSQSVAIGVVSARHRSTLAVLGQAILIAAALYLILDGWRRDFRVPLGFSSDSLVALMQSKSTVDNGWWWSNPMLSAPFVFDALAFPANSNVDQAIVWAVSRLVRNPAGAVTLAWMIMVVLSGLTASWCMRRLGASAVSSFVTGTLFALSPYAFYRNIDHFWMVIYLVPFPCSAALLLISGRRPEGWFWKGQGALLAGCCLLGFNYVYYAFFGCFFIGIAAIVGSLAHRNARIAGAGAICVALIAGSTLLNLAPSLYSWSRHGRPTILREKIPAESEVYGLKIRQLISPVFQHSFPPFRWWTQKEAAAQFPLETENMTSRLGFVGTLGFLGLLGMLFVPAAVQRLPSAAVLIGASQLTIAAVLLATIGGFGSLFSLLVTPEIRAYNRICPFIEFLSLAAVALAMDSLLKTRERRIVAGVAVLALGLGDQRVAAMHLNAVYPSIAAEMAPLEAFVRQLESHLPARAMVLQLPFRTYLNDGGVSRMKPYDHFKLYLVSRGLRWSYPALSNDQVRWQQGAARLDPQRLAYQLAAEGFAAVVIDRYGYDDNGAAVSAEIRAGLRGNPVIAETDRYLAVDIRSLAGANEAAMPALPARPMPATLAMPICNGQPLMNIELIGATRSPFDGSPIHVPGSGVFKVAGWAVDQPRATAAADVDVVIDQTPFPSFYGLDRSDVTAYFKRPTYLASGFTADIPADTLRKGQHTLSLRVVSSGGECYYSSPGVAVVID